MIAWLRTLWRRIKDFDRRTGKPPPGREFLVGAEGDGLRRFDTPASRPTDRSTSADST